MKTTPASGKAASRVSRAISLLLATALLAGFAASWSACGGSGGGRSVTFEGNVSSATVASRLQRPQDEPRFFARLPWPFKSLAPLVLPQAVAASCSSTAGRVFACAATGGPPGGFSDLHTTCNRVDSSSCDFSVGIDVGGSNDRVLFFFVFDENNDGRPGNSEPEAFPSDPDFPESFCNGDVVKLTDVDVNFGVNSESGTFTAGSIDDNSACAATPTPTGTQATVTPTATGPTPTVTPAATGTLPTPTATATGGAPTPTPTPTSACQPLGGACQSSADCCSPAVCLSATCVSPG